MTDPMTSKKLLCLDTATRVQTAALVESTAGRIRVVAEHTVYRKRPGPTLLDDLDRLLTDAGWTLGELDGFVCGQGPGSFTGLRITLATLKGLALALDRPIHAARTTEMLRANRPGPRTFALIDARRGQVYIDGPGIETPLVVDPERVPALVARPDPVLVGDGALAFAETLAGLMPAAEIPDDPTAHMPRAAHLAALIDPEKPDPLGTTEPIYVRPSDAELNYPDGFPDALVRFGLDR